jgi:acetate kinase
VKILVLNSGSSSQKCFLYQFGASLPDFAQAPLWEGKIEWHGEQASLEVQNSTGITHKKEVPAEPRAKGTERLLNLLTDGPAKVLSNKSEVSVVGHRIVNGGGEYTEPTVITSAVEAAIQRMAVLAPLHNRVELEGIELARKLFGEIPQVAVFDTAFHSDLPDAAAVYPGPYEWLEQGIRRFGFHGINHEYCAKRAAQMLGKDLRALKLVTCHLGNGCSLAAIQQGRSVDTTMGFTPLEGLMMGTRSGSVDPGILTYLLREQKLDGQQLDDVLNKKSGLFGISGISGDMRDVVLAMKRGHARAKLAFDIFVHRLQAGIGAMAAVLGGMDALVFTAGIGENSAEVREAACANLAFLGVQLNAESNAACKPDQDISAESSRAKTLVIQAREDWAIACECWKMLQTSQMREHRSNAGQEA